MKDIKKNKFFILIFLVLFLLVFIGCTPSNTPTYGSIDIQSNPSGAKVYIDGVDTGNITPYVKTHIEMGIHTIRLELFHYETKEDTSVMVYADETIYLNWALIEIPEQ